MLKASVFSFENSLVAASGSHYLGCIWLRHSDLKSQLNSENPEGYKNVNFEAGFLKRLGTCHNAGLAPVDPVCF